MEVGRAGRREGRARWLRESSGVRRIGAESPALHHPLTQRMGSSGHCLLRCSCAHLVRAGGAGGDDTDKTLAELSAKRPATWLRSQEEAGLRPQEAKAEELCVQGERAVDLQRSPRDQLRL